MKCGFLALGFAIAAVAAQGCSTDTSATTDAGDDGASGETGASCEGASTFSFGPDAGACNACKMQKCATELAKCASDCDCPRFEVCLAANQENFSACPDAISASLSGNPPLINLTKCLDLNCLAPCFPNSTGPDGG